MWQEVLRDLERAVNEHIDENLRSLEDALEIQRARCATLETKVTGVEGAEVLQNRLDASREAYDRKSEECRRLKELRENALAEIQAAKQQALYWKEKYETLLEE